MKPPIVATATIAPMNAKLTRSAPSPPGAATDRAASISALSIGSAPAGIDEIVMPGAHPRVVGREEQRQRCDVCRLDSAVEALGGNDLRFAFGRVPLLLPRSL